ncbi:MAG: MerR family transcriptional regulator, heat shock protein HspR [Nocardioidaceae bacterium]|nr:MerR family transcriptional regulator, heat shock protein HspR [Nocardioidaceae bacterium]
MAKARITFDVTNPDAPVFVISVAAELSGMHPQTLRSYDRMGLVSPGRADGGGRRYSLRDVEMLRVVAELTSSGIGIEGVRRILYLENQVLALRSRVAELEAELSAAMQSGISNLPVRRPADALTRYSASLFPGGAAQAPRADSP